MKKQKRISFKLILNILVAVLCIGIIVFFLYSENGLTDLINSNAKFSYWWILAALGFQVINLLCDIVLIYKYIHVEYKNLKFSEAVKIGLLGQFWGAVTPSSTGGQPMQIYCLSKKGIDVGYSTSRLMQKFLIFQITMTAFSIIAVSFKFNIFAELLSTPVSIAFVAVGFLTQLIVTVGFIIFSFNQKLTAKIITFFTKVLHKLRFIKNIDEKKASIEKQLSLFHLSNKTIYSDKGLLVFSIIVTVIQLLAMFTVPYCIYKGFALSGTSPVDMICGQAIVNLVSGMIPIPGASGAAEVGFVTLLSLFFTPQTIKSATLIWRIITYYLTILISAPFAYLNKDKKCENKSSVAVEPTVSSETAVLNEEGANVYLNSNTNLQPPQSEYKEEN